MSLLDDAVAVETLGGGGQATVYLMKTGEGEFFVLKRRAEDSDKARFRAAFEAHKRLDAYAAFQRAYEGDEDILALEYIVGPTLEHYEGMLSWSGAVPVLRQLCEAVRVLDSEGMVHRDLKPANLVLSEGRLVLIDLGSVEVGWGLTRGGAGEVPHTPGFASPELSSGAPVSPSENSYQIAAVARFLLGDFRQVPDDARAVLERCFETPLSRPNVGELLEALYQTPHTQDVAKSSKMTVLVGALFVVSVALVVAVVVLWKANQQQLETKAELSRTRTELAAAKNAEQKPLPTGIGRDVEPAKSEPEILRSTTVSGPQSEKKTRQPVDDSSTKPAEPEPPMTRARQRELRIKALEEAMRARGGN